MKEKKEKERKKERKKEKRREDAASSSVGILETERTRDERQTEGDEAE